MSSRRTFLRQMLSAPAGLALTTGAGAALAGPARPAFAQDVPPPDGIWNLLQEQVPAYVQPGVPRGVQLSFAGDDLSRRAVTWLTSVEDPRSIVQWGVVGATADTSELTADDLTHVQDGSSERAPFGDGADSTYLSAKRDNGPDVHHGEREVFVHRASLSGLQPGQRIAYRVGDGTRWSDIAITRGGPLADEGFRFTHVGDHGPKLAAQRTTRALRRRQPDWHLFAGDLSYANGDQRIWDLWAEQYSVMGREVPTMVAPGNHESKDFMGQAYRTRFTQPRHGSSFYDWIHGNVFMISTAAGAFFGDERGAMEDIRHELVWMEHTLARAAALRAAGIIDFIVVTQHFPSYTDHRTRGPISPDRVVVAEQILQRYQIDLLLVGHDHMYQRSHPMAYGLPTSTAGYTNTLAPVLGLEPTRPERYSNATGYIEVIAGSGGNGMYDFTEIDTLQLGVDPEMPPQRHLPWLAASARELCFVEYDVRGPEMAVTGFVFDDGYDENRGDGIPDNEPGYNGDDPRFLADADPEPFDTFTLVRKAYAEEVPTVPRLAAEILRELPEAHGELRYDVAEDCTTHDH
ncbi:Purple acid phosphatase [Euzebya pacifica]|uniref:Purple acid phosphatase n=1 Tax=Euzebya pacifica TaxID=1608957 RepID=A0A346XTR9_9ACTN|nr:metallophosphoesterase family protein [Euzebya pacifica]AXV05616.1 Purple acid phosphatase [Euzebya pacifica]